MKIVFLIITVILFPGISAYASTDHYDSTGKLYAVIACVSVVLIGIALFLFYLEKRISKMEKELDDR